MRTAKLISLSVFVVTASYAADPAPRKTVAAWETVDASFEGCGGEGACGARGKNDAAIIQPGAKPGQLTYCMVSGAVFEVKAESPKAEVDGKPVYFCCEACAKHFAAKHADVLAKRQPAAPKSK